MVGINTVLKDNPSLDSRLDEEKFGIEKRNPFRVVVDPIQKVQQTLSSYILTIIKQ